MRETDEGRKHFPEEVLLLFAVDPGSSEDPIEVESHLRECPECRSIVGTISAVRSSPPLPRMETTSLEDLELRLSDQTVEAGPAIEQLLQRPPEHWPEIARSDSRLCTVGGLRAVLQVIPDLRRSEPERALELSRLVSSLCESLIAENPSFVAHAHASAWKERAITLRILGRFEESISALNGAENRFVKLPVAEFDLAGVWYQRAMVLRELDQLDEALRWIDRAEVVFERFGQTRMTNRARYVRGAILFRRGEIDRAEEIFRDLLPRLERSDDEQTVALLYNSLGQCAVERHPLEAELFLVRAVRAFEALGYELDLLRARWGLARVFLATGRNPQAITTLEGLEHAFARRGAEDDAGLVALDRAEGLLALDRAAEATAVCRAALERLRGSSPRNVIHAVEFLRDAAAQGTATPALVRHVRRFMEKAPKQPALIFAPPA